MRHTLQNANWRRKEWKMTDVALPVPDVPPSNADVWVAAADGSGIIQVDAAELFDDDDDEELAVTPQHVIDTLGFDPAKD